MSDKKIIGYRAIKQEILNRIKSRIWESGEFIPREVELSEEFNCARATVNRALRELAEEGYLERKRKLGTRVCKAPIRQASFVIPQTKIEVESTGANYRYALVNRIRKPVPDWLGARLGLDKATSMLHLQCMHYANGAPFQFEDRWINTLAVPNVQKVDFSNISPNEWLINEVPFTDAEISFYTCAANASQAKFLSISIGEPVFTVERTTWLSNEPVTYVKIFYPQSYRMTTKY